MLLSRPFSFGLLTAGGALLLAAALLPSRSQPPAKPETPSQVAERLDNIFQPRFHRDDDRFGISRIITINGHETVPRFGPNETSEKAALKTVDASNRAYIISFLHTDHVPGKMPGSVDHPPIPVPNPPMARFVTLLLEKQPGSNLKGMPYSGDRIYQEMQSAFTKAGREAWSRLAKGQKVETTSGKWLLAMRPVRANEKDCLNCHQGAKKGDTLGVMVYAIQKDLETKSIRVGVR